MDCKSVDMDEAAALEQGEQLMDYPRRAYTNAEIIAA